MNNRKKIILNKDEWNVMFTELNRGFLGLEDIGDEEICYKIVRSLKDAVFETYDLWKKYGLDEEVEHFKNVLEEKLLHSSGNISQEDVSELKWAYKKYHNQLSGFVVSE